MGKLLKVTDGIVTDSEANESSINDDGAYARPFFSRSAASATIRRWNGSPKDSSGHPPPLWKSRRRSNRCQILEGSYFPLVTSE